ncbi:four-carbon acid sugar kinase family protein [Salinicoccus carnicancri]|uniref:four-carbon acid sugar kinase family protein n=1 Tax=Salinicoccus carnicancri TaxID=558170 RepID=UPI00031A354E|nr:four-carbon acid sugar kinase family protein [Salinicoccus carnicancri]
MNKELLENVMDCGNIRDFENFNYKVIVLDDDPTGTQTVKDLNVYTSWEEEYVRDGFRSDNNMFYIMTNSRAFSEEETVRVHREITAVIDKVSKDLDQQYMIISRGDSTLRGHSYLEPKVLDEESEGGFDAVFYIPSFFEGGRYTHEGIHYLVEGDAFIPVSESEFANDSTFGFKSTTMADYIAEKSGGEVDSSDVKHIDLDMLRGCDDAQLLEFFDSLSGFDKVVVDSVHDNDLAFFTSVLMDYLNREDRKFIFRTAASFVKSICATPGEILQADQMVQKEDGRGGIVVVGSHVEKTTQQLNYLMEHDGIETFEFDVEKVRDSEGLARYVDNMKHQIEDAIGGGRNAVVYTSRNLVKTEDREESLKISKRISESLVEIVSTLEIKPKFIIAKGGITSSDVATIGLGIKKARVLGQAEKGIPVWKTSEEAKYPNMPYIVFPGNVGTQETLHAVYSKLNRGE